MAHWREQHQKGSFRGAEFCWQGAETEIGRKTARHDYPLRDDTYVEDLGKAPREFTLDVLVSGPDYMTLRDKLVAALEEPGPGTLVHPTMGTMSVAVQGRVRLRESTQDGGVAFFSIPFVLAGALKYPGDTADTGSRVAVAADSALAAAADDFGERFVVAGQPAFVADAATTLARDVLDTLDSVRASLSPPYVSESVSSFIATVSRVNGSLTALVRTPAGLCDELQGLVGDLSTMTENPFEAYKAYRRLYNFGDWLDQIAGTTPSRTRQSVNQSATRTLVQRAAVIEAARISSQIEFVSYQEAMSIRDELADSLDGQMESAPDEVYVALAELRAAVIRDISSRGADLARIVSYVPPVTLPALVIAHRLYGDADRADEIIGRNALRHPGFVTGGTALEVLTDV